MAENDTEKIQKKVAYYSTLVNSWVQTRMEVDKTLIIISSAGIGFLVTLIGNQGIGCLTDFVVYVVALVSFIVVIICCVLVFQRNAVHIEVLIENPETKDPYLDFLDNAAKFFFAVALMLTLIIGVSIGLNQLHKNKIGKGGQEMTDNKAKKLEELHKNSLSKIGKFNPDNVEKSLHGLGGLNPDKNTNSGEGTGTGTGSGAGKVTTENK